MLENLGIQTERDLRSLWGNQVTKKAKNINHPDHVLSSEFRKLFSARHYLITPSVEQMDPSFPQLLDHQT